MRKIRLATLVYLGGSSRYLFNARVGFTIHGKNHIAKNIDSVLRVLRDLKFKVTLAASKDLQKLREDFNGYPDDARLSREDRSQLHKIMSYLDRTLRAEATTLDAYVLSENRFDALRLVEQPESLFAPETFGKLPRIAQIDVREAGRCIGFGLPTAGAFHLLRATEDSLRSYYRVFVKRGNIEKATWGHLVEMLRKKKRKPKPSETLLNHLDHIRKNFRNPTDHPEMIYDMEGVQDLLSLVVDVLNRVTKELPDTALDWLNDVGTATVAYSPAANNLEILRSVASSALDEEPPIADSETDEQQGEDGAAD